jgi:hypothetical protein
VSTSVPQSTHSAVRNPQSVPLPSSVSQLPTINSQPIFSPFPGETPRAFGAFLAFFDLGHDRSLPALADHLGEKLDALKRWSSRFRWNVRIQQFQSGLLQQHAESDAANHARQAADWARRATLYREQEWEAAQKLDSAVRCFLDSFGDRELEKMTLGQVSRALQISSRLARHALAGDSSSETPALTPIQLEIAAALKKAYAEPPSPAGPPAKPREGETINSQLSTLN